MFKDTLHEQTILYSAQGGYLAVHRPVTVRVAAQETRAVSLTEVIATKYHPKPRKTS